MKEVQIERMVRVTEIVVLTDEEADVYEVQAKTVEDQRAWAKNAKAALNADDVTCDKVKLTIRESHVVPEPKKKTKAKKEAKPKKEAAPKKARKVKES